MTSQPEKCISVVLKSTQDKVTSFEGYKLCLTDKLIVLHSTQKIIYRFPYDAVLYISEKEVEKC